MMNTFQKNLAFGQIAETQIARWLRSRGYAVLPAYDLEYDTGKGPRLFTPTSQLVSPDLLAMKGKKVRWVECKHKTVFTWYRKSPRADKWQTGADARHVEDYHAVATDYPFPVYLLFLHTSDAAKEYNGFRASPTGLYSGNLATIFPLAEKRFDTSQRRWFYYWHREDLTLLASLADVNAVTMTDRAA